MSAKGWLQLMIVLVVKLGLLILVAWGWDALLHYSIFVSVVGIAVAGMGALHAVMFPDD